MFAKSSKSSESSAEAVGEKTKQVSTIHTISKTELILFVNLTSFYLKTS
jgi:hypothetical protein